MGWGPKEFALIETEPGITFNVPIAALGGSVATPSVGLKANVIEVLVLKNLKNWVRIRLIVKLFFQQTYGTRIYNNFHCIW